MSEERNVAENKIEYIGVSTESLKKMVGAVKAKKTRSATIGSALVFIGMVLSGQMEMATAVEYIANVVSALMGGR